VSFAPFDAVMSNYLSTLAQGIGTTLELTALGFGIGCLLGVSLAAARLSRRRALRIPATVYVEFVRGIPALVWLFIIYFGLAQGGYLKVDVIQAGALGLGGIAAAYLSEIFRAAVGAVPRGQWEAAHALGLSPVATIVRVIGPQAGRVAIPPVGTYLIGLLKDSALVSTIGAQDITFRAYATARDHVLDGAKIFIVAGLIYILLSVPIATFTRSLDRLLTRRLVP
jgi:polar amino acid transport system permease protein